ncbi:MAG: pilus assembly protein [Mesorhizobium sp.]|nr:MAG: pilus assembly protein [Mesorhizobium sp.]TJU96239.1 MAG: pilus assembly protein [Mesorhizobium sp.]TJU99402.1 MAG: pilus assembly protein [Mesorhizobium sp.]TJV15430.1 MAG: pilus assembly protein [Mesorhizobium sp.]
MSACSSTRRFRSRTTPRIQTTLPQARNRLVWRSSTSMAHLPTTRLSTRRFATKRNCTGSAMFIKIRQFLQRFHHDEQGAALVEIAIVTPFVLLLSAGVFEFSNIFNTRLLLAAGVEDAARYMARCSSDWNTCSTLAKNLAVNGAVTNGSQRVTGWTVGQVTITPVQSLQAIDSTGTELYLSSTGTVIVVQVSTAYPYPTLGLWSYLGFANLTLNVFHQERVLGW